MHGSQCIISTIKPKAFDIFDILHKIQICIYFSGKKDFGHKPSRNDIQLIFKYFFFMFRVFTYMSYHITKAFSAHR